MSIAEFLGLHGKHEQPQAQAAPAQETDTVRRIVAALDQMDPDKARYVAAFAFILCRVARADLNISAGETRIMERLMMEQGALPEEQAVLVVQMAKTQETLFGGTENFMVTREFNRIATREQKIALLHCLFAVSMDELISTIEEGEISKIAGELQISHDELVAIRANYREYRAVLKRPDEKAAEES
jgi:uncharacterized tellurite resistance protein B-like protein